MGQCKGEMQMTNNNRLQGKKAQAAGKEFEKAINNYCELYKIEGRANIFKIPTGLQIMKGGKGFFHAKKTPFDFCGVLKGGTFIGIEAKTRKSGILTIDGLDIYKGFDKGIKSHQWGALADFMKEYAAVTMLLFHHSSTSKVYRIMGDKLFELISLKYAANKRSITIKDFEAFGSCIGTIWKFDFLKDIGELGRKKQRENYLRQ